MEKEQKIGILQARLNGETLRGVAAKTGCTMQNVSLFLKKLDPSGIYKPRKNELIGRPKFASEAQEYAVLEGFLLYFNDVESVQNYVLQKTGEKVPMEALEQTITYITMRRYNRKYAGHYTAIEDYMREYSMTLTDMERETGVPALKLSRILHMKQHMDLDTAQKIKEATGLMLKDIFAQDMSALQNMTKKDESPYGKGVVVWKTTTRK